jgi:hypothetical protein
MKKLSAHEKFFDLGRTFVSLRCGMRHELSLPPSWKNKRDQGETLRLLREGLEPGYCSSTT